MHNKEIWLTSGVPTGPRPPHFAEEFGPAESLLAVVDDFLDHVSEIVLVPEVFDDGPEVRAVAAETAEFLRSEGLKEKLVDGGDVMVPIHSVFAPFGSLAEPGLDLGGEVVVLMNV